MEKEIVFVLLDEFADWEAAFLAPALCSGVMPGRPGSYAAKYMSCLLYTSPSPRDCS